MNKRCQFLSIDNQTTTYRCGKTTIITTWLIIITFQVYDTESNKLLRSLTGRYSSDHTIYGLSNQTTVTFTTDHNTVGTGWYIYWSEGRWPQLKSYPFHSLFSCWLRLRVFVMSCCLILKFILKTSMMCESIFCSFIIIQLRLNLALEVFLQNK